MADRTSDVELFDRVKMALRMKNNAFDDDEIQPIIDACKIDLKLSGLKRIEDGDALIQRAVILYAKANFGFSADSERFSQAYAMLKDSMALAGDYNTVVI